MRYRLLLAFLLLYWLVPAALRGFEMNFGSPVTPTAQTQFFIFAVFVVWALTDMATNIARIARQPESLKDGREG